MNTAMSDLKFNVAQLLRETIGARRDRTFTEASLPIDESLTMRDITGAVRFTRTATGVYAHIQADGTVTLECVRSLEPFDQAVHLDFSDEFHSVVDVFTGATVPQPAEEDPFFLTDQHMIDVGDAIRAYALLELPMNPVSPDYRDAPVSYSVESEGLEEEADEVVDERLAALKQWSQQASNE